MNDMQMKKIIAILLCAVMVISMAACGSGENKPSADPGKNETGNVTENTSDKNTSAEANTSTEGSGSEAADPENGTGGSETTDPENGTGGSEITDPENGTGGSETTDPENGTGGSEAADPENGTGGSETTDPENGSAAAVTELEEKYAGLDEDDLTWEYNSASKTIVISGKGPMRSYGSSAPEWDKYYEEAQKAVIGDEVTSVGMAAFLSFNALTEVQLGNSVEYIGTGAFSSCVELRTVNFPDSLKYIGESAFNNALLHSDSGFKLPEGLLHVGANAFYSAFKENAVYIPSSLTELGSCAFANCFVTAFEVDPANPAFTSLDGVLYSKDVKTLINYPADKESKELEIPETVETILTESIEVTNHLEKIIIPASVVSVDEHSIFWNYALRSIEVDPENSCFKSVDGVLFSADGKMLLCYPLASDRTEYTIPDGTERICDYSMSQAGNLTEIHMPESLKEIGLLGLYLCGGLNTCGLPKSLESIGVSAFEYCDALMEVRFAGSSEDWSKVEISEGNDILTDGTVTVYCAE